MLDRPVAALFHQLSDLPRLTLTCHSLSRPHWPPWETPGTTHLRAFARAVPSTWDTLPAESRRAHSSSYSCRPWLQGPRPLSNTLFKIAACPQPRAPRPLYLCQSAGHLPTNSVTHLRWFLPVACFPSRTVSTSQGPLLSTAVSPVPSTDWAPSSTYQTSQLGTELGCHPHHPSAHFCTRWWAHPGGNTKEHETQGLCHPVPFQLRTPHLPGLPGPGSCSKTQPGTLCHVPTSQRLQP